MEYEEWRKFYIKILKDFGFSEEEDLKAGKLLKNLLENEQRSGYEELEKLIKNKRVNIFGAGPVLESLKEIPEGTNVACDGATTFLMERGIRPEIIVTDLDGKVEDQIEASENGSLVVIHAHGDNISSLKKHLPGFRKVIPTMQAEPVEGVYNFGGFTDGDRAVVLACHFGAREIVLYGFDFKGAIGRYSFTLDIKKKRKKLLWAERIIGYLVNNGEKIRWYNG